MTETTTQPVIITDEQVRYLNAARDVLAEIASSAHTAAWQSTNDVRDDGPYAHWYGGLAAAAEIADNQLFDVLNRAASTRVVTLTHAQLFNETDGREPDGQRMEGGRTIPTDR